MAYYQTGTTVSANQFLIDLETFAVANGWIIDFSGVYATSYRRLHLHKGTSHFDFVSASNAAVYSYACTGYASGSTYNLQPGSSTTYSYWGVTANRPYWFVSTANALYISLPDNAYSFAWGVLCTITQKIGNWSGGAYMQGSWVQGLFGPGAQGSGAGSAQLRINDAWTPTDTGYNGIIGSAFTTDLSTRQPNFSNSALLPIPILICRQHATDSSKCHPLGYAPEIYRVGCDDIYDIGEIITIGADSYIILPGKEPAFVSNTIGNFLFKLGA